MFLTDTSNQLRLDSDDVAFISCDSSAYSFGQIDQQDLFATAEQKNVTAIVFYSQYADWCNLQGNNGVYNWIYTFKSRNDTVSLLNQYGSGASGMLYATINQANSQSQNGSTPDGNGGGNGGNNSNQNNQQQQNNNPLGPSPSTAVAMIILYSITGIITALFLVIIVTGAIRAHRHPERYGPRNLIGRPRQSRARGIARAMLDTIPIVKFGDREAETKPTDVEIGSVHNRAVTDTPNPTSDDTAAQPTEHRTSTGEGGIAAAAPDTQASAIPDVDNQGCSICTEDFEVGQDQRVLPCDHRFHPACIDPWLLNVSGTCPLCRIDLRPQTSRGSVDLDEHGNPIVREGDEDIDTLPPPLAADTRRSSVRRSIMLGLMGIGRPDRLTREERVLALRRYRLEQAARRRRASADGGDAPQIEAGMPDAGDTPEERRRTRDRLRSIFNVVTRRTGGEQAEVGTERIDFEGNDRRRRGTFGGPAGH